MTTKTREVRELFTLANDFHQDVIAGTQIYYTFQLPLFDELRTHSNVDTGINRLCLFHLILTLSKWAELYEKYHSLIPIDVQGACRALRKEIERRGIRDFRNKVVGHIWDKRTRRPLTIEEVETRLEKVTDPGTDAFMRWLNPPGDDVEGSVAATIEGLRERIREAYGLTDADLL